MVRAVNTKRADNFDLNECYLYLILKTLKYLNLPSVSLSMVCDLSQGRFTEKQIPGLLKRLKRKNIIPHDLVKIKQNKIFIK